MSEMNCSPIFRIGIDLGGTAVKAGVVDQDNKIVGKATVPTEAEKSWEHVAENMAEAARQAVRAAALKLFDCKSVGIGCPGTINASRGIVDYSNNLGWTDVPLAKAMEERLGLPAFISNDANCAALGEVAAGAAKGFKDVVMLTLGTGVGSGIIIDGKIFEGGPGGAELGHTMLRKDGELCTCGRRGCLEAYASASALVREAKRAAEKNPQTEMIKLCHGNKDKINGKTVFDAAKHQDPTASQVIENYTDDLADGIADAVNIFRPEVVLLGGGISRQGEYLTSLLSGKVSKRVFGGESSYFPQIRCAMLENDAGTIGAANLG